MKLRVQQENGNIETITLVPPCEVRLGDELNVISDSSGMEHWFTGEGYYDGWGMPMSGSAADAEEIAMRVESAREIEEPK